MNSWAFNTCTVLNLLHLLFILVLKLLYLWPNKLVCKYFLRIFFFWLFDLNKELKQLCWDIIQISYISQSVQLNAFYSYRLVQPSSLSTLGTLLLLKKETSHQVALSSFSLPHSLQFSSVPPSCPTLCDPMNCSTAGLPVHHQLLEFTQTHVHPVGDAIQPSHLLSSPSPASSPSQNQGLLQWVSSSQQVAKVLEFQLQHQSF